MKNKLRLIIILLIMNLFLRNLVTFNDGEDDNHHHHNNHKKRIDTIIEGDGDEVGIKLYLHRKGSP
jgi:hypothetical protein